jgi:hypothetical protein
MPTSGGGHENSQSHFLSIYAQIYFVRQLNRKACGLIRVYFHTRITEKSDIKDNVHSYSQMNKTTVMCFYIQLTKNA